MSIILTGIDMPKSCSVCEIMCKHKDLANIKYSKGDFSIPKDCPLKSVDGLIEKVLMEVDGGTDDRWIRTGDALDNVEASIKEYCEVR